MSLRLLIDEDSQAKLLVDLLRQAGHDVVTINELELSGSDDTVVLDRARKQERVLLTQNCQDFEVLFQLNSNHAGILAIYQDSYFSKNMLLYQFTLTLLGMNFTKFKDCTSLMYSVHLVNWYYRILFKRSLIWKLPIPLANQFIALNHWKY